jgi:hypothetical protein
MWLFLVVWFAQNQAAHSALHLPSKGDADIVFDKHTALHGIAGALIDLEKEWPGLDAAMQHHLEDDAHGSNAVWKDSTEKEAVLIEKFVRAIVAQRPFVVSMAGMSDVAGHGNFHEDAYTHVFETYMAPAMEAVGIPFEVRNHAMGGTPSYPHSLCMDTVYGSDVDVLVWDFRMVEAGNDPFQCELFLRHAIMMESQPVVMFKVDKCLGQNQHYYGPASVHVVQENDIYTALQKHPLNEKKLQKTEFCDNGRGVERGVTTDGEKCPCPGQVNWHTGYMKHRVRGAQWAHLYLRVLEMAVKKAGEIVGEKPEERPTAQTKEYLERWKIEVQKRGKGEVGAFGTLPPQPFSSPTRTGHVDKWLDGFTNHNLRCATSWTPAVGLTLQDLAVDMDEEVAAFSAVHEMEQDWQFNDDQKWRFGYPDGREMKGAEEGFHRCNYEDAKLGFFHSGTDDETLRLKVAVEEGNISLVAFCGNIGSKMITSGELEVYLDGTRIEVNALTMWPSAGTLGVQSCCWSVGVASGGKDREIGFKLPKGKGCVDGGEDARGKKLKCPKFSLTHIMWL